VRKREYKTWYIDLCLQTVLGEPRAEKRGFCYEREEIVEKKRPIMAKPEGQRRKGERKKES